MPPFLTRNCKVTIEIPLPPCAGGVRGCVRARTGWSGPLCKARRATHSLGVLRHSLARTILVPGASLPQRESFVSDVATHPIGPLKNSRGLTCPVGARRDPHRDTNARCRPAHGLNGTGDAVVVEIGSGKQRAGARDHLARSCRLRAWEVRRLHNQTGCPVSVIMISSAEPWAFVEGPRGQCRAKPPGRRHWPLARVASDETSMPNLRAPIHASEATPYLLVRQSSGGVSHRLVRPQRRRLIFQYGSPQAASHIDPYGPPARRKTRQRRGESGRSNRRAPASRGADQCPGFDTRPKALVGSP